MSVVALVIAPSIALDKVVIEEASNETKVESSEETAQVVVEENAQYSEVSAE